MNGEYKAKAMIKSNWWRRTGVRTAEWKLSPCYWQLGFSMLFSTWQIPSSGACCLSLSFWVFVQILASPTLPRHPPFPWNSDLPWSGAHNRKLLVTILAFLPRWGGQLVVLRFSPWLAWYHQDSQGLLYNHKSLLGHIFRKVQSQHYLPDSRLWSSSKMAFLGYGSVWALGFLLFFVCRAYYFSSTFFINNYVRRNIRYIPIQ